ncbi:hypothetical protein ABIC28_005151 [Rhodococcus sp. PvR044]|uniref:hypothetical protein n=1 Tax=Rhodococcus sp. PvR044 TaxID=3156402 RepID=UPI0033998ABD
MDRPTIAHLTPKATAEMFRRVADRLSEDGYGARIFGWRRLSVIWETKKPPRQLLPIDRKVVPVEDLFGHSDDDREQPEPPPRCRCDGAAYETKRRPFLVHPDCPIHAQHTAEPDETSAGER